MAAPSCILCSRAGPFRKRYAKGGYGIEQCAHCGLVQLVPAPSPETLAALYGDASYFAAEQGGSGYAEYGSQEREYVRTFQEDVRRIAEFLPGGRLLDVGCGYGYFLECALAAGYDAYGIDVSPVAVRQAELLHPGRVFRATLADAPDLGGPFDAIFASHLIEHLLDPVAFLRAAAGRLRPGGLVVLVTPNVKSLLARVSGPRWVSFKVPEHVCFYDPGTMNELLRRAGFEARAIDSAYQYYALPFVAARLRELLQPLSRLVPRLERLAPLRTRCVRVTSGSMRVIAARRPEPAAC